MSSTDVILEEKRTSYSYQPLDQTNSSIRLIALQPSLDFDSDIHCDIFHVSLETEPEYEALSYAWGDPSVTATIFLQGHPFQATVNLVSALRHVRGEDEPRVMWVDAICIDQANIPERGQQVTFMREIYSSAKCDLLWLGEDPHDCGGPAFEFMESIADIYTQSRITRPEATKNLLSSLDTKFEDDKNVLWERILLSPPVWKRIWIVQEIAVARNVYVYFGRRFLSWDILHSFVRAVYSIPTDVTPGSTWMKTGVPLHPLFSLITTREHLETDPSSIMDLWEDFEELFATDPRDKIFALLGLADDGSKAIRLDYSMPVGKVFINVARAIISQTRGLGVLCQGHAMEPGIKPDLELPSWVLDFSDLEPRGRIFRGFVKFSASSSMTCLPVDVTNPNEYCPSLVLHGIMLDSVMWKFESHWDWDWDDVMHLIQRLPEWIFEPEKGQERRIDACARTFITDVALDKGYYKRAKKETIKEVGDLILSIRSLVSKSGTPSELTMDLAESGVAQDLAGRLTSYTGSNCIGFHFSPTAKRNLAMIPDIASEGDVLCVLYGSDLPHVLRRVPGKENTYELVGNAYIDGYMDGEAVEQKNQGILKEETFVLV